MQIITVDDDAFMLEVLSKTLSSAGHDVVEARNGLEALKAVQNSSCRLVITDWMMPEMDGLELCRALRSDNYPNYVYVILLTSRRDTPSIVEGLSAGADDYLGKPFHPEELKARIRAAERMLALETRELAVFAMAKLAESRDNETGLHLERMCIYSRILAQGLYELGKHQDVINGEYTRLIHLTSPLHDIGKVGIPDSVLLKPGRLNDREFAIMKTHTHIGANTLDAAASKYPGTRYLSMARDIALTHHERFDGEGYPNGTSGSDIPLCGRIVALADVYDALTSKRVYKDAYTHDMARSMILDECGTHFDPDVVEAFIHCEQSFVETYDSLAEQKVVMV